MNQANSAGPPWPDGDRRRLLQPSAASRILPRMPRYFFHLFNDETTIDDEGRELADVAAARAVALDSCRELVCESVKKGHLNLDHRIEITDDKNARLMTVTFREAFTLEG